MSYSSHAKKKAKIHKAECVACGSCMKTCPLSALRIVDGIFAEVNDQLCVGCGKCKIACPASVIEMEVRG